ncbi:hypothetical protein P154DRAFT_522760 [Amniculicola lignicola CBS 123094]|uniref:Uncharacterized protein n=1 Tax=Amniculicola lignicola CBS 123094 TaxID=1392246 RepID=A0A6A5WH80_9PLEO|nr:hypothetical protein P154DRAFT_522760 [Amniculicola lignicola CBS 123094]
MPPRIPVRYSWPSATPIAPAKSTICFRSFTSTPTPLALGPESPNYIEVPKPAQPSFPPNPRVKGILPIPRNVFKTRSHLPKESDEFIRASTPDAQHVKDPPEHSRDAEYQLYKRRLAESRKQALRQGVAELHERRTTMEQQNISRVQKLQAERHALMMAPPRDADVLTATSVSKGVRDFLGDNLTSTSRSSISEGRRTAFQRRMHRQAAVRQARVHDLYVNARQFIVDETQLDEAIEKAFGTEEAPVGWDQKGLMYVGAPGKSPWAGPAPEGAGDMMQRIKGAEGVNLAKERVKRLAEELTGGKM